MTDLLRFTPPALAGMTKPPVLLLRDTDRRARRDFKGLLIVEGLTHYSPEIVREEARTGLRALWEPDDAERHLGRVEAYWQAVDAYTAAVARGEDADLAVDDAERNAVEDLLRRLGEHWEPLRRLAAANAMYASEAPTVVLALLLRGWENVSVLYSRDNGKVTFDKLEELEDALGAMEREHGGTPGLAYMQVCGAALERLFPGSAVTTPAEAATAAEPEHEPADATA